MFGALSVDVGSRDWLARGERWRHYSAPERRLRILAGCTHRLHDGWQGGQSDADLGDVGPAPFAEIGIAEGRVNDLPLAEPEAIEKSGEDAGHVKSALAPAALIN